MIIEIEKLSEMVKNGNAVLITVCSIDNNDYWVANDLIRQITIHALRHPLDWMFLPSDQYVKAIE